MSKDKTDCTASYRRKRMTNKEAIKILQNDGCCQDCTFGGYPCKLVGCETHQALDLAIKALEERPQGDLISRTWLKEHKFTTQVCNGVEIEDVDVVAVATIDNATTVVNEYTKGLTDGERSGDLLRQQCEKPLKQKKDSHQEYWDHIGEEKEL